MIDFVEKELTRVWTKLAEAEPGTEEYEGLLRNISALYDLEAWHGDKAKVCDECDRFAPAKTDTTPAHVKKSVEEDLGLDTPEEAAPQTVPFPEPFPEPFAESEPVAEPAPETGRSYTKEEVRAALAESRKRGVKVTALLGELGYDNFSAVPAGEYGAVMAKLGEA